MLKFLLSLLLLSAVSGRLLQGENLKNDALVNSTGSLSNLSLNYSSSFEEGLGQVASERGWADVACTMYDGYCFVAKTSKCQLKCSRWSEKLRICRKCKSGEIYKASCSGDLHYLIDLGCKYLTWTSVSSAVKGIILEVFF